MVDGIQSKYLLLKGYLVLVAVLVLPYLRGRLLLHYSVDMFLLLLGIGMVDRRKLYRSFPVSDAIADVFGHGSRIGEDPQVVDGLIHCGFGLIS